jgi:sugar phosphate isomerase/epimerase
MCPLGEGMVDFPKFFGMLAAAGFRGPISLHLEYDIEAPTKAAEHEKLLQAIERDFQYLSRQTKTAFG